MRLPLQSGHTGDPPACSGSLPAAKHMGLLQSRLRNRPIAFDNFVACGLLHYNRVQVFKQHSSHFCQATVVRRPSWTAWWRSRGSAAWSTCATCQTRRSRPSCPSEPPAGSRLEGVLFRLNPTPYTLHPTPYTLHPTPLCQQGSLPVMHAEGARLGWAGQ